MEGKPDQQTVTVDAEEFCLILDLATVARRTDDGRIAPMMGGSARAMAARKAVDKYNRVLR